MRPVRNHTYEVKYQYSIEEGGHFYTGDPLLLVSIADLATVSRVARRIVMSFTKRSSSIIDVIITSVDRYDYPTYIDPNTIIKEKDENSDSK